MIMKKEDGALAAPKTKNKKKRELGISWKLFGDLLIFVAFMLVVIWLFQVVFLNNFYKQSKIEEIETTEKKIIENIADPEALRLEVSKCAMEFDECIRVFEIKDNIAVEIADADMHAGCIIHHISSDALNELYLKAQNNGGTYTEKVKMNFPPHSKNDREDVGIGMVKVSIHSSSEDKTYVIMLNSEFFPLNATVSTLERQFVWIAFVLIIGALIFAFALAKSIWLPMQRMSASARRLATGDYDAKFEGGEYKESQELAEALNYAAEELAKADNLKKELVANISHDLRTPLTMIKGYGEVMRDIPEENTPENVQVIIDETERLTNLVNDMLDLSKLSAGTIKPQTEEFNLTETVKEVMLRYGKLTEKDGYDISFEHTEEVYVRADKTMILQVVYNLINNAVNYSSDDKRVVVSQKISDGKVRISVRDNGTGIAPEDLPLVWDRYYKVDKVHKRATVGTGLGLSIVKGVLESHGASYGVDSKVGEGSTFWFELPVNVGEDEYTDAQFSSDK